MAPASASPQPPSNRADAAGRGGQGPEAGRGDREAPGSAAGPRGGRDPHEQAEKRCEVYGPLSIERHVKQDGRALVVYTRQGRRDQ